MDKKTVLVIGNYAREHALAWKLSQSPRVGKLYMAPGNGGTGKIAENVPISQTDIPALVQFALDKKVDVTVVGPEDPFALGIVDSFQAKGLKIFGPTQAAAQIESSKTFAKTLMKENGIPTATFKTFDNYADALEYVKKQFVLAAASPSDSRRVVIKADGLALGKGVTIAATRGEAEETLKKIMVEKVFGDSGSRVVIEEFLKGEEFSAHAFSDGKTFKLFPFSQDHKAIFDGDKGPNTGGIGTIAPLTWVGESETKMVEEKVVGRVLEALKRARTPFRGLLYPGLMMTSEGPKVIEFNDRFGDPECEIYMRLLKTDLLDIVEACIDGTLEKVTLEWQPGFACCIILCSGGYPGAYEKGKEITGVEEAEKMPGVVVFHAGTKMENPVKSAGAGHGARGRLTTSGGRVLGVTAAGATLKEALDAAYKAVDKIHFEGMHYRKDIGGKALRHTS